MSEAPKPEKLEHLLASAGQQLGRVLERARGLEALTDRVRAALPEPDSEHVVAVSLGEEALVVTADSAAWAARLRFAGEAIRAAAGAGATGKKLLVRVRPPAASESGGDNRT